MAYLYEGDRVWTAVAGPAASADMNTLQDQLRDMLGPRVVKAVYHPMPLLANEWQCGLNNVAAMPAWYNPAGAAGADKHLILGVPVMVEQKITSITAIVSGTNAAPGGAIAFCHGDMGAVATSIDLDGVADCWDTGGEAYANRVTYTNVPAVPISLGEEAHCFFYFTASNVAANLNYIWDAYVTVQLR